MRCSTQRRRKYRILPDNVFLYTLEFQKNSFRCESFLDVLEFHRQKVCKDPRDKIFAFLGHPKALLDDKPIITPDYAKSAGTVYHEVVSAVNNNPEIAFRFLLFNLLRNPVPKYLLDIAKGHTKVPVNILIIAIILSTHSICASSSQL